MNVEQLPGQRVAERYRVVSLLGQGGMGAVFRATDERIDRDVALKVVLPVGERARQLSRFTREARLSARLAHPHVVQVLDYGRFTTESGEQGFLAMELVEGTSLEHLLDAELALGQMCELVRQVLTALAHVHARGVLHRDIKPDNILVSRQGDGALRARVTDFGLAWALSEDAADGAQLTVDGTIVGTPAYMAPEQAMGHVGLGPATDLYALGVVFYRLLSGRLPFEGAPMQMLFGRLNRPPAPLTARSGLEVPPLLVALVEKLLARHPEARFSLAADVIAELAGFVEPVHVGLEAWQTLCGVDPGEAVAPTMIDVLPLGATLLQPAVPSLDTQRRQRLWGRDEELAVLDAVASRAEGGDGQVVVLRGEAGVGKTALAEAQAIALNEAGRFRVLRGQAGADGVLGAMRSALDGLLDTHGRAADAVELAVRTLLAQHQDDDEREVVELMALLRPEVAVRTEDALDARQLMAAFARMMRRLARVRPVQLVLDDLPGDHGTASLLEVLLFELTLDPFALLATLVLARGHASEQAVEQALARTARTEGRLRRVLELEPLERTALAQGLEATDGLSPHLAEHIARRAGGNPLFARHLVEALGGASSVHGVTLTAGPDSGELPAPLVDVLSRSLDERLRRTPVPARARLLLEHLAVLDEGAVDVALLAQAVRDEPEVSRWLAHDLDALIEAGILADQPGEAVGFANALFGDVILAGVDPGRQVEMHRQAADARRARGEGTGRGLGRIGEHLAAAGQLTEAVDAWLQAVEWAARLGMGQEVARWGARALAVMDVGDPRRPQAALRLARALRDDADLTGAEAVLEPLLEHTGEPDLVLQVVELLADIYQERAELEEWQALLERAEAWWPRAGRRGRAALLRAWAFLHNMSQRFADGRRCAEEALELTDDPVESMTVLTRLVWNAGSQAMLAEARDYAARAMALAGDRPDLMADALRLELMVHGHLGDVAEVERTGQHCVDAHRRTGRVARLVAAMMDVGLFLTVNRQPQAARPWLEQSHALADRFGLLMEAVRARLMQVASALQEGDLARARIWMDDPILTRGLERGVAICVLMQTWTLAAEGHAAEAVRQLEGVDLETVGISRMMTVIIGEIGEALRDGAPVVAWRLLERARERWIALGDMVEQAHIEATMTQLGRPDGA